MLQPGDLFDGLPSEDIPQLIRKKNDKFWVFPIKDYSSILKTQIQKSKKIPEGSKSYLKGLIDFMDNKIDAKKLESPLFVFELEMLLSLSKFLRFSKFRTTWFKFSIGCYTILRFPPPV
jgi:hypothetical protein